MRSCLWETYRCPVCLLIVTRPQLLKKKKKNCFVGIYSMNLRVELNPNSEVGWNDFIFPGDHHHFTDAQRAPLWFATASLHAATITMKMLYTLLQAVASPVPEQHKRSFRSHSSCHLSALALIQALKFKPNAPWPQHGHADLKCWTFLQMNAGVLYFFLTDEILMDRL